MNDRIRELRAAIAENEAENRALYSELSALLVEVGRRPPDGSDQPALFRTGEPTLFEG